MTNNLALSVRVGTKFTVPEGVARSGEHMVVTSVTARKVWFRPVGHVLAQVVSAGQSEFDAWVNSGCLDGAVDQGGVAHT